MSVFNILLTITIVILIIIILCLMFSTTNYFKNILYKYNIPVLGETYNLKLATVPTLYIEESSLEEPSSYEEPKLNKNYDDQSILKGMYSNEQRIMNSFGNLKRISDERKQDSEEIDNLLQKLYNASNSGYIN